MVHSTAYFTRRSTTNTTTKQLYSQHNAGGIGLEEALQHVVVHVHTVSEVLQGVEGGAGVAHGEYAQRAHLSDAVQRQDLWYVVCGVDWGGT